MRQGWLLSLSGLLVATPAFAGSNYRYVHRPEADVYFGHISYCELKHDGADPRVVRAEGEEEATVNLPLAPGNTILTTSGRRCEAQFDTGTLLRLDGDSGLRIETILAPSLTTSDKLTNLHLQTGRVHVLYRDYDSSEVFQILTPNAAVKLGRSAVIDVRLAESGETLVDVERGQASILYGPSAARTRTRKLKAGERATIGHDHELVLAASPRERSGDAFADWNREMNERFAERHEGKSALPKPIARHPRAVINFAQRFSDPYGEWIWSELYGYVWRPYLSRDEGWRPYHRGRWVPVSGRLFWVPEEPWGWVPYHLGLWHWDKKHGWVWLPGSAFAPAWVSWYTCDDVRYYRPLGLWDWHLFGRSRYPSRYAVSYAMYSPFGGACGFYRFGNEVSYVADAGGSPPAPSLVPSPTPPEEGGPTPIPSRPELPLLPLPAELEKLAKQAAVAVQRGDPEIREAVERTSGSGGIQRRDERAGLREERPAPREEAPAASPVRLIERFRDWNADVRAARSVGGEIVYSSVTNMVRCQDCQRPLMKADFGYRWSADRGTNSGPSDSGGSSSSGGSSTAAVAPAGNHSQQGTRETIRD